jgi:hypothetical protein
MSDQTDQQPDEGSKKRGDAAWKAARERVAERNDQARKAGKQQRQAYERQKADARRAAERRQMEQTLAKERRG